MMDRILMEGMSFHNHTGVNDSEKKHGQIFTIDVELELPPIKACETDRLADPISYSEAYGVLRPIFQLEASRLIQRLCGVVAERLLATFDQLSGVQVTVRKPYAPIDGAFDAMGVRIHRTRVNLAAGGAAGVAPTAANP